MQPREPNAGYTEGFGGGGLRAIGLSYLDNEGRYSVRYIQVSVSPLPLRYQVLVGLRLSATSKREPAFGGLSSLCACAWLRPIDLHPRWRVGGFLLAMKAALHFST